eukprot:m.41193 g.41193  ORF g.41193 m.41193 type:complete len:149 (-) comp11438_c0_seq1:253-699(-)
MGVSTREAWVVGVLVLSVVAPSMAFTSDTRKLQIGIKRRASKCLRKTTVGDIIAVHYTGQLHATGEEFDSSFSRGEPFVFTLGTQQVIQGWDRGLMGMCIDEVRKLVVPANLAYGELGAPPRIPANAPLMFEIELVNIEGQEQERTDL